MAFSESELRKYGDELTAFLDARRPPEEIRDQVDLGARIKNQTVEIFEIRPRWNQPSEKLESPIAKATYVRTSKRWKVYWMRGNLKWHLYDEVKTFAQVLAMVDRDERGCFWG